jgi:hypothetical protein
VKTEWDGRLTAFSRELAEQRAVTETSRQERRVRYRAAVAANVFRWRQGVGHNAAPVVDEEALKRGLGAALGGLVEWRVLVLCAPLLVAVDNIGRSWGGVARALSRGGVDQYRPKPRGTIPDQVRVEGR